MNTHARYIPQPELNEMITQLGLSRIETSRGHLVSESHGELPSSDNPFNPELSYDVKYQEPRLSNTNRVLTKYENKGGHSMNIALYNTRTHALNAEDVPSLSNNNLHKDQMERARGKIQQR